MTLIELKNVSKNFSGTNVLKNISITFEAGRFYTVLGINGAGKSTLLSLMTRGQLHDSGEIFISGKSIEVDDPKMLSKLGLVSENIKYRLPISFESFFKQYRNIHPRWNNELFLELVSNFSFELKKQPSELSRGQCMQAALLATLPTSPEILLLDEITSVLDPHIRFYLIGVLRKFVKNGGAVVFATNIITEVHDVVDQLVLIHRGEIKINKPMADISDSFIKLRREKGVEHAVFRSPECMEVTLNHDLSVSYLVPANVIRPHELPAGLLDRRKITCEEAFMYFTQEDRKVA